MQEAEFEKAKLGKPKSSAENIILLAKISEVAKLKKCKLYAEYSLSSCYQIKINWRTIVD